VSMRPSAKFVGEFDWMTIWGLDCIGWMDCNRMGSIGGTIVSAARVD
jgi:hypothetical protein